MKASGTVSEYPHIPRIDVHAHIGGNIETIASYLRLREVALETHQIDLAMWIDLGDSKAPETDLEVVEKESQGRVLCCIHDYSAHKGLTHPPEELAQWIAKGYNGYKIWSGPPQRGLKEGEEGYPYVDDPAHEPTFAMMEKEQIVGASIHIADPNGPYGDRHDWLPDPVEYWRNITAWRHVLERHPNLKAITAHMSWLCCQDAQLDYLRNMLSTFPGLSVDLAATFQYFYLVDRENLRSFSIEFADRILFGTDISSFPGEEIELRARRYFQCFQILETDEMVPGGFFEQSPTRGLALPKEVLEKIYYKNAAKIYPRVGEQLQKLGYEA